jgi:hypothetical protein
VLLVFGGRDAASRPLADTWSWDGTAWRELTPAHAPAPRLGAAMAFDETRDRVVLFGGYGTDARAPFGDTWELDGTDWTQRAPAHAPAPRHGHAATFDPRRGVTVLFGGFPSGGAATDTETWEFDGADWREVATATSPTTAVFPALVFHRAHGIAVLTGAIGSASAPLATWVFDGTDWSAGPPAAAGMVGRQGHAFAYDEVRDAGVLFGGASIALGGARPHADTFELALRAAATAFGQGCMGRAGELVVRAVDGARPELGRDLVVEAGPLPAGAGAALLLGFDDRQFLGTPLPLDLGFVGLPGCQLLVAIDATVPMAPPPSAGGAARHTLQVPLRAELAGGVLFAQALAVDPALPGILGGTTNGLRLALGN